MSSHGELIQALKVLKNVKEKRHGIKTLASLCANRAFQVRIVQRGGWRDAILPLIISLDEECRKYAALAIANLSTSTAAHQQLLDEDVLRHLVPILNSEEVQEVVTYVLNALGNFACSPIMWPTLQKMNAIEGVASFLVRETDREDTLLNVMFTLANFTADPVQRQWMMQKKTYELVWKQMQHPNYHIMQYSLTVLRGLAVETSAQDIFPKMGLVPLLIGIFQSQSPQSLRTLVLEILLHFSFLRSNADMMLQRNVMQSIESAARGETNVEYVPMGVAIIANLCENIDLHVTIVESPLFEVLTGLIQNDSTPIQQEVIRALMLLSLSPKYHHVILATGVMANVCPIAMTERLPVEMRTNALQMMGAVCATHPTTPTESDIMDLLYLCCKTTEDLEVRRACMMVIANASADAANSSNLLRKPFIESLVITLSKSMDTVLVDYMMQFFHNLCKLDHKAGSLMVRCGYQNHMFQYERLESLSLTSAIYLCDTCRQLAEDGTVRASLMQEMMIKTIIDAWVIYIEDPQLAPHLALMASALTYHSDSHQEFVLQGGVKLVLDIYTRSKVEHVRLCCILSMLYLAESTHAQRAVAQERGMQLLLSSCENESHIDLVTNSLKTLIPFASSDDYRPELGQAGALDTFCSFLFSEVVSLQQLAIHLLQNLLELRANRRIFLGLAEEKQCEEDYLEPLVRFLPHVSKGPPKRIIKMNKGDKKSSTAAQPKGEGEATLTPHDPFIVRSVIHSIALLSLEQGREVQQRFVDLGLPLRLFNLFYSEQVDKSSGEAILLFFANILHSEKDMQGNIMRGIEVIPMLLVAKEMDFSSHTNTRCLSALLCISRSPDYRRMVVGQLDLLMASVNANLSSPHRDEDFYSCAAVHCSLLCELSRISHDMHPRMAKAGVVEAFLVFITIAGRGLNDEICVELLLSAVYGIAALVASPASGEQCMQSLLFPATRLQLFMSLLRLPAADINAAFHKGTVGVRTLQRAAKPEITDEELHVDNVDCEGFIDLCGVRPAAFMYRNVIRTLCLLLAHPDLRRRVQEAISPANIVPTTLFALRGAEDFYVQVFGFLLVGNFSGDADLRHSFVSDTVIINELLNTCRRFSPESAEENLNEDSPAFMLAAGVGGGLWSAKSVQLNKYMLAMIALTNFAESVKEVYRDLDAVEDTGDGRDVVGRLTTSNKAFVKKFAALCLRDTECESLTKKGKMNSVQEFTMLLKTTVVHNAFVSKIELSNNAKGGEVQIEPIGVSDSFVPERPSGLQLIPEELRMVFKNLGSMQQKCDSLLQMVDRCLEASIAKPLVKAIVECLCGITFVSPMCILKHNSVYKLIKIAPEWLQPTLVTLFCNSCGDIMRTEQVEEAGDPNVMSTQQSDYLFPLISTSPLETRQRVVGALANMAANKAMLNFVMQSGVFRIVKGLQDRGWFIEHFGLVIEMARMLTNLTCRVETHELCCTEKTVAFLRDTLRHSFSMLQGALDSKPHLKKSYEEFEVTFEEDDVPPLGLRILWEAPPKITEVLPDTPAARLPFELEEGDELIEVNGIDVTEKGQWEIAPMFETRPLQLVFRREVGRLAAEAGKGSKELYDVVEIETVKTYGDRDQYIECFNLALLTIHNLAKTPDNHPIILAEPKILACLIELIPCDAVSPSLRRLTFSILTCLAQNKDISGTVFTEMSNYFMSVEKPDASLQKFIMLCANLFYTSMKPEEVKPDKSMLVFVGRLASLETAASSNVAMVEVLHGMARAPRELRQPFVCRETMVVTIDFIELHDQFDVQLRAFESAYFLTLGACDPVLWAGLDVVPRMAKAAAEVMANAVKESDARAIKRADGLFEIVMRTADLCLVHDVLLRTMTSIPELDRYLMDLFVIENKPLNLMGVAAHLMSTLLKSKDIGPGCWQRWRSMGFCEKIVRWFTRNRSSLEGDIGKSKAEDELGTVVDTVLHMLLQAVSVDESVIATLVAEDPVKVIAQRIVMLVGYFKKHIGQQGNSAEADSEAMVAAGVAFRNIGQMVTALSVNEQGLSVMSKLHLEEPLAALLELPADDFRVTTLVILSSLARSKESCTAMIRSQRFMRVITAVQITLQDPGSAVNQEELEYLVCIVDRGCCFPELANQVKDKLLRFLCLLPSRSDVVNTKLMGMRALSRCTFVDPSVTDSIPSVGLSCLHYIMANNKCLKNGTDAKDELAKPGQMDSLARRKMMAGIEEMSQTHPSEARLIEHFSRAILCETVKASRASCVVMLQDLDPVAMLDDLVAQFDEAYGKLDHGNAKMDIVAGEMLNLVMTLMHVLLCVIFRKNQDEKKSEDEAPEEGTKEDQGKVPVDAIVGALGVLVRYLDMGSKAADEGSTARVLGETLTDDIRVLWFVSALLHESCAKALSSSFVKVVRSRNFLKLLSGSIRCAERRLQRLIRGPPPKEILAGQARGGVSPSPLAGHLLDYNLPLVWEHLVVSLRQTLVQSMYVKQNPSVDDPADPWLWGQQEAHELHQRALEWIPPLLARYHDNAMIRMEVMRYLAAASSFYVAPEATENREGGFLTPNGQPCMPSLTTSTLSLLDPRVMDILTHELETSQDPCVRCLAGLAASNLAMYEQAHRKVTKPSHELKLEGLSRLIEAVFHNCRNMEKFPKELGVAFTNYTLRFICNLLCFDMIPVTVNLMHHGAMEVFQNAFDMFFRDVHKIESDEEFVGILRTAILLLRNWVCAGVTAERETEHRQVKDANVPGKAADLRQYEKDLEVLQPNLELTQLFNWVARVVSKVTDGARDVKDKDKLLDALFEDVLVTFRTILQRSDTHGEVRWKRLHQQEVEFLLQNIKEHRYERKKFFEDEDILYILYLMTKQAYTYLRLVFPDYLMEVAYGHREEHTLMQDMAAICCAMISTQGSDGKGPTCNVANVVKDNAAFVHALAKVPDVRMRLWHYRLITSWSQKPHVLDDVSADVQALKYIVDALLDPIMGRYSVVILHNISVLRSSRVIQAGMHLAVVCEAYRKLQPITDPDVDAMEDQRRMLRRMLVATVRNSVFGSGDINAELSDVDLKAVVELSDVIEAADVPLYLSLLLQVCEGCAAPRCDKLVPGFRPLVKLLVKQFFGMAWPENLKGSVNDQTLYDILPSELLKMAAVGADIQAASPTKGKKDTKGKKELTMASPMSPTGGPVGLGRKTSLYQQRRRPQLVSLQSLDATASTKKTTGMVVTKAALERRTDEQEFVYFAALEILTYASFREASPEEMKGAAYAYLEVREVGQEEEGSDFKRPVPGHGDQTVREVLDEAFTESPLSEWMKGVANQVKLHQEKRVLLSDVFMTATTKFIWHCWGNSHFRIHFNTPTNMEILSKLIPFFLTWSGNEDVPTLMGEICLYSGMHRYQHVTDFLVENQGAHGELAVSMMTRAMNDEEAILKPYQCARFLHVFVELLRNRNLNRPGMLRLVTGLETCLLKDHPKGMAAYLMQKDHALLSELLDQLYAYNESGSVKQSMVVTLALTAGQYYKPTPELDEFVLRILDLAAPLLEGEFELFFPVIYRFASKGGVRVRSPLLQRNLHHRCARILAKEVAKVEAEVAAAKEAASQAWSQGEGEKKEAAAAGIDETGELKLHMTPRQKVQWILALFTSLAGAPEADDKGPQAGATGQDLHFDSFVCVDLLPILVRILRADPQIFDAVATCFLMSSVSRSPCIDPHMPDVLRLAEFTFPGIIKPVTQEQLARLTGSRDPRKWEPLTLAYPATASVAMRRSFLHLLTNASHVPRSKPALLESSKIFRYMSELQCDPDLFEDPYAVLHAKIYTLAQLCNRGEKAQAALMEMHVLDLFESTHAEVMDERSLSDPLESDAPDMRIPWIHCMVSLAKHSGLNLLQDPKACELFNLAVRFAEDIASENLQVKRPGKGISLVFEAQQALAAAIGPLSARTEFGPMRQTYTMFLLGMACSAPLLSLRLVACDFLCELFKKGHEPEVCGAVFLKTPCLDSFVRMITGPLDDVATSIGRVLVAMASNCGYKAFVHQLSILDHLVQGMGSPTSSSERILQLAELFMTLTKERTIEVIDALVDLGDISKFMGLARSGQSSRRELVQRWLEAFGSSFYEVDEVSEVFQTSTLQGLLYLAARSQLEPGAAQDLRRLIFGSVYKRIESWRSSMWGANEFCTEALLASLVPVCELQPDLVAAVVALFHSFITKGERQLLDRVWSGGHVPWLCKRMTAKSRAQLYAAASVGGPQPTNVQLAKSWEKHTDLIAAQGMILHVLWQLYDLHPVELSTKCIRSSLVVSNWTEFITYYCQHIWPLRETKAVEEATDATLILAMQFVARLARDANQDMQVSLVKQGVVGLCMTVCLPNPQDQKIMREALLSDALRKDPPSEAEPEAAEASTLLDAKMVAGAITAWLLKLPEVHRYMAQRQLVPTCVAMFEQVYSWRRPIFEQQGSVSLVSSVGAPERFGTLYSVLLSHLTTEWSLENLEMGRMSVLNPFLLDVWSRHGNPVLQHHCLRIVSGFCQVHALYCGIMADEGLAELMGSAVHRTFGVWDVRELRHVLRLLIASLAFSLGIPVMPENAVMNIKYMMERHADCEFLRQLLARGGALQANATANKRLLTTKNLTQVVAWAENPGDPYAGAWALWLVTTLFAHEHTPPGDNASKDEKEADAANPDSVLVFAAQVNERALRRRAALRAQQAATGIQRGEKEGQVDPNAVALGKEADPPKCRTNWLRSSTSLSTILARIAGKAVSNLQWKEAAQIGCIATARLIVELPQFLHTAVQTVDGHKVVLLLGKADIVVNLAALQLTSIISSFRLSLKAQNLSGEFLKNFHALQEVVIEGIASAGQGPYEMMARWLAMEGDDLPCRAEFKCLVAFMLGQCICPPLAAAPVLDMEGKNVGDKDKVVPTVATCEAPPVELLDYLAKEILSEDQGLKDAQRSDEQGVKRGPLFSTILCHLLYALAVLVPIHPKAAANSAVVRGAAFMQLMKIQNMVAQSIQPTTLYDPVDAKDRMKLFLYARSTACIRSALQSITGSWLAADFGARFAVTEEGGKDFIQYCTKHINQAYNNKTALTRVIGTPWERVMLSQGPTQTIAELLLVVCSTEANLREVKSMGGEASLHSLSRYGESAQVKQQATMLLTKLAVLHG